MAKWYEAANEASFKATDGGYVFRRQIRGFWRVRAITS